MSKNLNLKNFDLNQDNIDELEHDIDKRTHRKSRERRATDVKAVVNCSVTTQTMGHDRLHTGANGAMVIEGRIILR